ncbi:MAG: ABC transporter substrate-binding protein [Spirochaetes bacterium]|nr:ABC transporter substrate-binding protein [Spirochaetota bacterium]
MKKIILVFFVIFLLIFEIVPYNRIISISPALTEAIYLLDSQDKLIANTTYCIRPDEAKKKEKIGNLVDINIEKIIYLKPDLVLTTVMTKKEKIYKLINIGIKVEVFPEPKTFSEICKQFRNLAGLVDKYDLADYIIRKSIEKVEKVKNKTKSLKYNKIFVEIGINPLFTITKESYINDFIKFNNGMNIAINAKSGIYSREKVLISNPDAIIIIDMGIDTISEINEWNKYKNLNALKNDRIKTVDSYLVCSPNPQTFADALIEFTKIIHPEIIIDEFLNE